MKFAKIIEIDNNSSIAYIDREGNLINDTDLLFFNKFQEFVINNVYNQGMEFT